MSPSDLSTAAIDRVKHYHEQTKHEFNRFARSLGYLDWANQPDPFRRFRDAPLIPLPLLGPDDEPVSPPYEAIFEPRAVPPQPLTLLSLSRFLEYALSITAWKAYGRTRWALRSNPSSGNLHPTEGYLFLPPCPALALAPGLYHYAPKEHALEQRMVCSPEQARGVMREFPDEAFLVGLSSIYWREAWKYGERAFRYCQHDVGHAIGTLRIAAATLGWKLLVLDGTADDTIAALLGLDRREEFVEREREYPELLAVVWPDAQAEERPIPLWLDRTVVENVRASATWYGRANRLSRDVPVHWELIDEVSEATWKHEQDERMVSWSGVSSVVSSNDKGRHSFDDQRLTHVAELSPRQVTAGQIIHQRRSAVDFDGKTSIPVQRFYAMLRRVMPRSHLSILSRPVPWDAIPWDPTIHLVVFVHRVEGLAPGLYALVRHHDHCKQTELQAAMHEQFRWATPPACPPDLPFFLLEEGDVRNLAVQVSCWQDIAGDSAFSLGMLAEFDQALIQHGPSFYRRLFWEAGLIGHVLYLEAEAAGVRATGIGCFFDDPVHRLLGVYPETRLQSLYHFTVGGPILDDRLTILPPYEHLKHERASPSRS
ncbi:MAG: SagB/ThcOx family dehydrogenase [Nitrospirae bacterium]|nr:MAG: SagB/ThcOx family dehydrogenase [Nitrospirota bacterium]